MHELLKEVNLPVGGELTTRVVEQKRTAENSKSEPGLQGLGSGLPSPVFLWQRWRKA